MIRNLNFLGPAVPLAALGLACLIGASAGPARADTILVESDASTLGAALGSGAPSASLEAQLEATPVMSGLSFVPVLVGSYGTFTPVPTGAPATTEVINLPPGDGESGYFEDTFTLPASFTGAQIWGVANVDDYGAAFLNGNLVSTALEGAGGISEFGNASFGTADDSLFLAGQNTLVIVDDNYWGGPSGAAFYADVTFNPGGTPSVPEPATLSLLGMGLAGLAVLRKETRRS